MGIWREVDPRGKERLFSTNLEYGCAPASAWNFGEEEICYSCRESKKDASVAHPVTYLTITTTIFQLVYLLYFSERKTKNYAYAKYITKYHKVRHLI